MDFACAGGGLIFIRKRFDFLRRKRSEFVLKRS
jgi:hypothetical protein